MAAFVCAFVSCLCLASNVLRNVVWCAVVCVRVCVSVSVFVYCVCDLWCDGVWFALFVFAAVCDCALLLINGCVLVREVVCDNVYCVVRVCVF